MDEVIDRVNKIRLVAAYDLLLVLERRVQDGLARGDPEAILVHEAMQSPEVAAKLEEARNDGKICAEFCRSPPLVSPCWMGGLLW